MSICLHTVLGCFCATMAEVNSCHRPYGRQSLKYLSGPSQKKFTNPWFKQFKNLLLQLEIWSTFPDTVTPIYKMKATVRSYQPTWEYHQLVIFIPFQFIIFFKVVSTLKKKYSGERLIGRWQFFTVISYFNSLLLWVAFIFRRKWSHSGLSLFKLLFPCHFCNHCVFLQWYFHVKITRAFVLLAVQVSWVSNL